MNRIALSRGLLHNASFLLISVLVMSAGARVTWAEATAAGEWPGLWGPARDARVAATLELSEKTGLEEVWRRAVGRGYSEPVVVGDRGYTTFSDGEVDQLVAFEIATGREIWRSALEKTHRGHDGSDDGPISTPVIDGHGRIFILDPFGHLFAHRAANGERLWRRHIVETFGTQPPYYGFGTTPLLIDGKLIVLAGGSGGDEEAKSDTVVALDPATGDTLWGTAAAEKGGYSSPTAMTFHGVAQIVANSGDKIFSLAPRDGSILWSIPAVGDALQGPLPLPDNRFLILSWNESAVFEVAREGEEWKIQELWRKPALKASYSPAVYHDSHLYGMNRAYLTCLDAATGEVRWRHKVYDASLILVGDHLAVLGMRSGNFHLVEATPEEPREVMKLRLLNPGALSLTGPVYVHDRFLLRNSEEMVMLKLVDNVAANGAERSEP